MKKMICMLIVSLLLLCCGCGSNAKSNDNTVTFYYCTERMQYKSEKSAFFPEQRKTDSSNLTSTINLYLRGPLDEHLDNPFPAGVTVVNLVQDGSTVKIKLSNQIGRLSGIDLTIACAALTMTASQLTNADTVVITGDKVLLDGKDSITLSTADILLIDSTPADITANNNNRGA